MQAKTSSDGHDLDSMEDEGIMSASSNGRKESYRSVVKERRGDAAILPGGAG